jgi:hypothetical protein
VALKQRRKMHHLLLAISVVSLIAAVTAFGANRPPRDAINVSLANKSLKIPERLFSYDAGDIKQIAAELKSHVSDDRRSLLDLYIRPVLIWNDIVFAITLAIFSATLWLWVIMQFELAGLWRTLVIAAATSAMLYGIFDVAEDVTLVRLFRKSGTISEKEGWFACQLTRLKMVTIAGSITGVAVFETLSWLADKGPVKPHDS